MTDALAVFDVDGTLFDSRPAVAWAYAVAGVHYPPEAWGRPWREWLPRVTGSLEKARLVHAHKEDVYLEMIGSRPIAVLPAGEVLTELARDPHWSIAVASSASEAVVSRLLSGIGVDLQSLEHIAGADVSTKRDFVARLAPGFARAFYLDDLPAASSIVCEGSSVQLIDVSDRSADQLRRLLWMQ